MIQHLARFHPALLYRLMVSILIHFFVTIAPVGECERRACGSVCLYARARNSKTIVPIDLIFYNLGGGGSIHQDDQYPDLEEAARSTKMTSIRTWRRRLDPPR